MTGPEMFVETEDLHEAQRANLAARCSATKRCGPSDRRDLNQSLNRYPTPDEGHNADGKHITYLQPSTGRHHALRVCDPDLTRCLGRLVVHGRSVQALEECGALPTKSLRMRRCSDSTACWSPACAAT